MSGSAEAMCTAELAMLEPCTMLVSIFQVAKLVDVIVVVPFPNGRVRGMVTVLPNTPIVLVDWPGFWPPATTKQLTFDGQLSSHVLQCGSSAHGSALNSWALHDAAGDFRGCEARQRQFFV